MTFYDTNNQVIKSQISLKPFYAFLCLAYGISWVFWIPAAFLGQDLMTYPTIVLHTLGGFGPSLAGILMVYHIKDREWRQDFWHRTIDIRQVGLFWTMAIMAFFPLLTLASIGLSTLVGGPSHTYTTLQRIAVQPGLLLFMLLNGLISGPIPEELGWRGFAQDILNDRLKLFRASIVLGLFWGAWHLPLFFILGTTQYSLGINSLDFWLFMINPIPLSALFAWVYYQTGRSILSAILMHLSFNFTANLLYPLSSQAAILHAVLLLVFMVVGLVHWKSRQTSLPNLTLSQPKAWKKDP